jgi:SnoaL-like domain
MSQGINDSTADSERHGLVNVLARLWWARPGDGLRRPWRLRSRQKPVPEAGLHGMKGRVHLAAAVAIAAGMLVACGGASAGTPAPSPSVSAQALARQLYGHLGAGDTEAAAVLVSDDATWDGGPGCSPTKCVGSAAIQKAFVGRTASHPQYTLSDFAGSGSGVAFKLQVASDRIAAAGVPRILVKDVLTIKGGKVSAVTETFDTVDPATATYVRFLQAQPAPSANSRQLDLCSKSLPPGSDRCL